MNERIQGLWDKATFDESRIVDGVYHPYIALQFMGEPGRYSITDEQKAKFAELIVRECAEQIVAKGTDWVDFAPSQTGVRPEYWAMAQQIKQHFGVEE